MGETRIHLVRHGEAAAGFSSHRDPGLSELGRQQADRVADLLVADFLAEPAPARLYSSPLARARETALPLLARWSGELIIEERIAEIPSPTADLEGRAAWLRDAMQRRWSDLDAATRSWRDALSEWLFGIEEDCIAFSHYVAINAAVGIAENDDRMHIFSPDNCSVTTLVLNERALTVERLGATASTHIN